MKVIILCAGLGSRTGLDYPKSLFKFNDQECLIEKNIKTIKKMGVKNKDIILINSQLYFYNKRYAFIGPNLFDLFWTWIN